jgi:hypothetical protein
MGDATVQQRKQAPAPDGRAHRPAGSAGYVGTTERATKKVRRRGDATAGAGQDSPRGLGAGASLSTPDDRAPPGMNRCSTWAAAPVSCSSCSASAGWRDYPASTSPRIRRGGAREIPRRRGAIPGRARSTSSRSCQRLRRGVSNHILGITRLRAGGQRIRARARRKLIVVFYLPPRPLRRGWRDERTGLLHAHVRSQALRRPSAEQSHAGAGRGPHPSRRGRAIRRFAGVAKTLSYEVIR